MDLELLLFFARMSREAVPYLKRAGAGRIINIITGTTILVDGGLVRSVL